jgi:hypothetical protein
MIKEHVSNSKEKHNKFSNFVTSNVQSEPNLVIYSHAQTAKSPPLEISHNKIILKHKTVQEQQIDDILELFGKRSPEENGVLNMLITLITKTS